MGQYKIEDLENRLNSGKIGVLRNEIIAENGKQTAVYVGEATGLHFCDNGKSIKGSAKITRYDRNGIKKKIKFSKNPFKTKIEELPKNIEVWSISTRGYEDYVGYIFAENPPVYYFIEGEKISKSYKYRLDEKATKKNLKLSDELFNALFGPIEEKLMKFYTGNKD